MVVVTFVCFSSNTLANVSDFYIVCNSAKYLEYVLRDYDIVRSEKIRK